MHIQYVPEHVWNHFVTKLPVSVGEGYTSGSPAPAYSDVFSPSPSTHASLQVGLELVPTCKYMYTYTMEVFIKKIVGGGGVKVEY